MYLFLFKVYIDIGEAVFTGVLHGKVCCSQAMCMLLKDSFNPAMIISVACHANDKGCTHPLGKESTVECLLLFMSTISNVPASITIFGLFNTLQKLHDCFDTDLVTSVA